MDTIWRPATSFTLTPHKISVCALIQLYATPSPDTVPFPFSSVSQHNCFAIFLISLIKATDDFVEQSLERLIMQLKAVTGELDMFIAHRLTERLSSLSSADELFNFFAGLQVVFGSNETTNLEDEQISLDTNSILGMFVRRCTLTFNVLSFEGACHLLTNIAAYCDQFSSCSDLSHYYSPIRRTFSVFVVNDSKKEAELLDPEKLRLANYVPDHDPHRLEAGSSAGLLTGTQDCSSFFRIREVQRVPTQAQVPVKPKISSLEDKIEDRMLCQPNEVGTNDTAGHLVLRTNWQVQGFLKEKADLFENKKAFFRLHEFENMLKLLEKLAPELHRVHYLRHLNSLYHEDYINSLDNLRRYFDYSAGLEGIDTSSSSFASNPRDGKYETALLCLGILHCHFGHFNLAMQALTEAVQICHKNSDDFGLACTLAAICDLLSNIGVSSMNGILGSSYCSAIPASLDASLSTQRHLLVLLKQSLERAESLKNARLIAFNRLALAKFDLEQIKRPLLSFGPNASTRLRTCPISVCEELRISPYLLSEFGSDAASLPTDGSFCTSWLKKLEKSGSSSILLDEVGSGCNDDSLSSATEPSVLPNCILQLCGASYLARAASWELYGSSALVRLNALVHAICFADCSSSSDSSLAYVKLVQYLATYKGYQDAFTALSLVEKRFPPLSHLHIQLLRLQLLHEHFIHRGCIKRAQQVCDELGVLVSSASGVDMDLKAEVNLRHARTLLAAKQFDQAASVAHSLFCMCYEFNMQIKVASALLLMAEIHKKAENACTGLPYALASLTYCQSFNLDLLGASATLTLADLWLCLGSVHAKRALSLLHQVLPMILGHGGLELRARANISIAKCYLADSTFSVVEDPNSVLDPLNHATEELEILQYHELATEAFYLTALIYNALGKFEEREAAATSFKKHMLALENPGDQEDSFL
ncbi:anaphase-promoting complex subunit 5 [Nymphaea colorata]|nr:anaphase-promoting complex subunit 5 [Nymphaea colorata]